MDDELDELFAAPLAEFVNRRDALSKRLRESGDKAAAGTVKALRKPSAAAWAIDQVARDHGAEVGRLLAAGEALAAAQEQALAGDRSALRDAADQHRREVDAVVRLAAAILDAAGVRSATHVDDLRTTVQATAVDAELREKVRSATVGRGALTTVDPLAGLLGASVATTREAPKGEARDDGGREERERTRAAVGAARGALSRAQQKAHDLRRELEEASAHAERLAATAATAAAAADALRDRLERAERDVADAEQELRAIEGA